MATRKRSGPHPDLNSPLVIDVSRLGRRPGSMMTVDQRVPSPVRIGLDLIAIEPGAEMDLDLRFEAVSEGVLVSGTVFAPTRGECARCLGPITGDVEIALTELFAYPDSITESTTESDEVGRVIDQTVDLAQPIIDAVGLALPFVPVCAQDCPGLCPQCGAAMATAEAGHHHELIDPRWAKLAAMRPQEPGGTEPDGTVS
ncbi:MAG: YceD family protein [Mycobacterium sp.]